MTTNPFLKSIWAKTVLAQALTLLTKADRRKTAAIAIIQVTISILDLAGIALIGTIGTLSVTGLRENSFPGQKVFVSELLNISALSFQSQVAIIGASAAFMLIAKTILSVYFTRRIYYFLSRKGAQISADSFSRLLSQDITSIEKKNPQEIIQSLTIGIQGILIGVLATSIQILADVVLLFFVAVALFILDPILATVSVLFFLCVAYLLHLMLGVRARKIGKKSFDLSVINNEKILEALNIYRELVVKNRRAHYATEIRKLRELSAENTAELSFMPYISKYIVDSAMVLSALLVCAYAFTTNEATGAISIVAVFIAAISRIAPGALRIQQGVLTLKSSGGAAEETFKLLWEIRNSQLSTEDRVTYDFQYHDFVPQIQIAKLSFKYPSSDSYALKDINLNIAAGTSVAIVGPSGAGKSTLVDLILGVLNPTSGGVTISNKAPSDASKTWPGAISYVPQEIFISNSTIRENVALGYPSTFRGDEAIRRCLANAQLQEELTPGQDWLDYRVGIRGSRLSGGQKQRLGIARAMFTDPKLLVLDEATSALDGQTEYELNAQISSLRGRSTLIVIAHKLTTLAKSDRIIYLDKGKILGDGTFEELRSKLPEFEAQVLLGQI